MIVRPRRVRIWDRLKRTMLFLAAALVVSGAIPPIGAFAINNGDGLILYGEGSVQTPRWRTWTNSTNTYGAEASLPTASNQIHQIQTATAPSRQEAIAAVQTSALTNALQVYHYNGTTWTNDWQFNVGFNNSAPRFDVAYAQSSGKGVVFYSGNASTTNELRYRTFDGTSWSAEQTYDAVRTSGTIAYVRAVPRAGTDEIAVMWADDSNMDLSANYLNVATGTWSGEPAAAFSTNISRNGTGTSVNSSAADIAIEQSSGEVLLCWGDNTVTDLKCATRTAGTSGTWSSVTTYTGFALEPVDMHMASEPGTDYIAFTNIDDAGTPSGEVAIWNGSTWGNIDNYAVTSLNSNDAATTNTSVGWVRSGSQSRAIVTFDDRLVSGVDWRIFNKNTSSWATQTAFSTAPTSSNFNDRMHEMVQNPWNPGQLMFIMGDFNDDLFAKKVVFDGTSVTWSSVEGGAVLEATLPGRSLGYGWEADFAYYAQDNTPALTYEQSAFRFFNNANSTDVGTTLAAANTAATLGSTGAAFRLRQNIVVGGGTMDADAQDFKLQFAGKGAGTCASPSGTPSSYTDVTTSTAISYKDNATPTSDAAVTANANDPTHDVNETYVETNNFTSNNALTTGQSGMWDFSLYDNGASAGTAYCFRVVKSSGTALNTYTNYAQVTTSSNSSPNSPTSLAQTKTDNTTLNTGDWTNESSVKFTASVSDPDASDTLQLCVEVQPIGTAFNGTETCGTGAAYSGTPVSANVTISGLSDGTEYHWQARTKDAAAATSSYVSYGGNAESARDFGVDTSAPTGGTVYDGTSVGVDAMFNDNSLSSLSANWSGFNANASGLARYDYSIGTTAGGTDVKTWTSNGTSTSVTATGLTLQTNKMYFVNVRAVDNAGNVQSGVSSDGQLILPSLSFGVSSPTVTFNNLNPGNSYTDTQNTTLTTSTNAFGGYVIKAFITGALQSGSYSIGDYSGGTYAAPDSWQGGDTGFGYTSSDTSVQGSNIFQAATCPGGSALAAPGCYAPFSHTGPGDIVADHTTSVTGSPITNEAFTIYYRVTASATQQATKGYATTIVYSVTPKY